MAVAAFSLLQLVEAAASPDTAERILLDELDAALVDPGAFRLTDAPLSDALVADMHAVTREFFEQPFEVKARCRYVEDQYTGWCGPPFLSEYGSGNDRKEMFHIGPRFAPTLETHSTEGTLAGSARLFPEARQNCALWPGAPERFVEIWHEYYRGMQTVAASLGTVLAAVLGIPSEEWFAVLGDNWADLAANYYPPVSSEEGGTPVYQNPHRDLTVFTILHQDRSRAGGLSVETVDGEWHDVEPIPGTYVVNVGDLLTYLSGGHWRAAPHQVTVFPDAAIQPRISVPFFYRPSDDRIVTSFVDPDAAPIAVGDWVIQRKRAVPGTD
jgi:isopenicillin N synthase-like dioxygenase